MRKPKRRSISYNIYLEKDERPGHAAILTGIAIILSFMIIAGYAVLVFFDHILAKFFAVDPSAVIYLDCAYNAAAAVFLYFECVLIGVIITNSITVSFLVPDEVISEAASMRDYLLTQGIPEDDILMEDKSASTYENMKFSKQVIEEQWHENERIKEEQDAAAQKKIPGKRPRKVFVTTNYHVFRSGVIATGVGITAAGVSAPTKWYFWPNAAVREFAGLLSRQRKKQAIILITMIVAYVAVTASCYYMFAK